MILDFHASVFGKHRVWAPKCELALASHLDENFRRHYTNGKECQADYGVYKFDGHGVFGE